MRTRTTTNFILFSFATAALLTSCGGGTGFKTDDATGVQYRFIKHDDNGTKPTETCFAHIQMVWSGKNVKGEDTVFLNTMKRGGDSLGAITIPLKKTFNGSLEQAIMMMAKGDSAVFSINADSLFLKTFHAPADRVPKYVTATTMHTFNIKLLGFQTQQEMMAERQAMMQKRMEMAQGMKMKEPADIAAYLQKNYPNAKPDADSIFILKEVKGKGKMVKEGDSIQVGYTGMLLNGTIFDQSDKGPGHRTLGLIYSKDQSVIRVIDGWIKVLGTMHEGDKVTVLLPSKMAYGPQGNQGIPPYSPLIFDMELVSIKSNK